MSYAVGATRLTNPADMFHAKTQPLRLADIFSDNMVLQQGVPIPVWGRGAPGEKVTVLLGESQRSTAVSPDGSWTVRFDPMDAGCELAMGVESTTRRVEVNSILTGEVWICSGQSNMEFPLRNEEQAVLHIAHADHPRIRNLSVPRSTALEPRFEMHGSWMACSPATAGGFSAVAYHFATNLQSGLQTPVGLITSAYGGSSAEAWIPASSLGDTPNLAAILATWEKHLREYPGNSRQREQVAEANRAKLAAAGIPHPPWPLEPKGPSSFHRPSVLFNAMVHPLIPFPARGVLWYQGEANFTRANSYRKLLTALIGSWRQEWKNPDLWFLIAQLPVFGADWIGRDTFAEIREAQMLAAGSSPRTAISCNIDLGDPGDIHPRRKQELGERLAKLALGRVYGKPAGCFAPEFRTLHAHRGKIRLEFDHAYGLHAIGSTPLGFMIAGADKHFIQANAAIDGQSIDIDANFETTRSVRYAWSNAPTANVYNGDHLPLFPFRTDDWPFVVTPECVRYFDELY